jgi:hypothetical protein
MLRQLAHWLVYAIDGNWVPAFAGMTAWYTNEFKAILLQQSDQTQSQDQQFFAMSPPKA